MLLGLHICELSDKPDDDIAYITIYDDMMA